MPIANAEQLAMMQRGQIDAAWAPEPWGSRLVAEADAKVIAEERDLWPSRRFVLTVIVTTPEFLSHHADVVKQVLGVHLDWTKKLQSDPQQYAGALGEAIADLNGGKKLPPGVLVDSLKHVEFTADPLPETFSTMGQWAFELGFAREAPKLEGLIDTTLLDQMRKQ